MPTTASTAATQGIAISTAIKAGYHAEQHAEGIVIAHRRQGRKPHVPARRGHRREHRAQGRSDRAQPRGERRALSLVPRGRAAIFSPRVLEAN